MTQVTKLFATVAIVPAMTSAPIPYMGQTGQVILALCLGGEITIDTSKGLPPMMVMPCCAKGCRRPEDDEEKD